MKNTDGERLDWLIFNSAKVCHSRDGDCCWVRFYYEEAILETETTFSYARDAIDAAMSGYVRVKWD